MTFFRPILRMDALSILKAELAAKRKLVSSVQSGSNKKYMKKSDLEAAINEPKEAKKTQESSDEHSEKKQPNDPGSCSEALAETQSVVSRKEVVRKLRERGEPILLFGETETDAFRRLRRVEIQEPEINKGFRNDFQAALEQVDIAFMNEVLKGEAGDKMHSNHDVKVLYNVNTSIEDIMTMLQDLGKGDPMVDYKVIADFMKLLLQQWGQQLNSRPEEEKTAVRGKLAAATYAQTQSYLKPLMRKLETRNLSPDILDSLCEITKNMLERDYIKANHAYLQMAIGNAPWPIGVTMVGIHARTGREKIFSKHVAHVLNDETQRKFIQGIKRLMTKCQTFYPTEPSKSVEWNAMT